MNLKQTTLSAVISVALASPFAAQADLDFDPGQIFFDPDGTGSASAGSITAFNWSNGTAFLDNVVRQVDDMLGGSVTELTDSFIMYAQATLGNFEGFGGVTIPTGAEFTMQLAVELTADSLTNSNQDLNASSLLSGGTNVFKIWYDPTADTNNELAILNGTDTSNAAGDYYGPDLADVGSDTCDLTTNNSAANDGSILIFCGVVQALSPDTELTVELDNSTIEVLDDFGNADGALVNGDGSDANDDNYDGVADCVDGPDGNTNADDSPNVTNGCDNPNWNDTYSVATVTASGGFSFQIDGIYRDPDFFKSNVTSMDIDADFSGDVDDPFNQTQPSRRVLGYAWDVGTDTTLLADGTTRNLNNFGCALGETCDFVFEHDSSSSFEGTIPEPTSLALLGLGLAGMGLSRRGRKA